jgi:hypothetical protein
MFTNTFNEKRCFDIYAFFGTKLILSKAFTKKILKVIRVALVNVPISILKNLDVSALKNTIRQLMFLIFTEWTKSKI